MVRRKESRRTDAPQRSPSASALSQHNIVDRVLSYCVLPYDLNPLAIPMEGVPDNAFVRVPRGAVWLAKAARTCKAWLEPALQHHYRTLYLHRVRIPTDIFERVGHLVRALVIHIAPFSEPDEPNIDLNLLTNLSTLLIVDPRDDLPHYDSLLRHVRLSWTSLPNLSGFLLWFPSNWNVLLDFFENCENLTRLALDTWVVSDAPIDALRLARPEKLEELVIFGHCTDTVLMPLYESTRLVTLNIQGAVHCADYRALCQGIEASSRSLRSLCLQIALLGHAYRETSKRDTQALANALASCTSLRFLRLGIIDEVVLIDQKFGTMSLQDLFQVLAPLPIELLCLFGGSPSIAVSYSPQLVEAIQLLPNLSVLMIQELSVNATRRLQSRFKNLVFDKLHDTRRWPPLFHTLKPEAQAKFQHHPYRVALFPLFLLRESLELILRWNSHQLDGISFFRRAVPFHWTRRTPVIRQPVVAESPNKLSSHFRHTSSLFHNSHRGHVTGAHFPVMSFRLPVSPPDPFQQSPAFPHSLFPFYLPSRGIRGFPPALWGRARIFIYFHRSFLWLSPFLSLLPAPRSEPKSLVSVHLSGVTMFSFYSTIALP
jgi:hypothetical protein